MILPRRQQAVLDQIERALNATDPQLRSSYAAFARRAGGAPFPAAEVITTRPIRFLVLGVIILLALGFLAFGISDFEWRLPLSRVARRLRGHRGPKLTRSVRRTLA